MSLRTKIESLLFISIKPLTISKIAAQTKAEPEEVKNILTEIKKEYNNSNHGIHLMQIGQKVSFSTAPENASLIREYLKDEQRGDLTRPALETLCIIAYRGPISKSDLDAIRGVNCALILRNLLIKGLIESFEDKEKMQTIYRITFDFLKYLGISEIKELPDYEKLHMDENLEKLLSLEQEREQISHNQTENEVFN